MEPKPHSVKHLCAAHNCPIYIAKEMLMCSTHWKKVPHDLRQNIRMECPQPSIIIHPSPTPAYLAAVEKAKDHIHVHH